MPLPSPPYLDFPTEFRKMTARQKKTKRETGRQTDRQRQTGTAKNNQTTRMIRMTICIISQSLFTLKAHKREREKKKKKKKKQTAKEKLGQQTNQKNAKNSHDHLSQ